MLQPSFIYPVFTLISFAIMSALGLCLLLLKTPVNPSLNNYRIARRILAVSYFTLALSNILSLITDNELNDTRIDTYATLSVSAFQAFLFTFTTITLLNTNFAKRRDIIRETLPICCLATGLVWSVAAGHPETERIVYCLFYIYYILQLARYTHLFFTQERLYHKKADNFFSDIEVQRLAWVRTAFLGALGVGILASLSQLFPGRTFVLAFTLVYVLYYLYFAIKFINYAQQFQIVEPVVTQVSLPVPETGKKDAGPLEERLTKWIEQKGFLASGITINDLAMEIKTNRTYLSNYINRTVRMNFKTWINRLRLEEAKHLMVRYPGKSIGEIADLAGFNELSTFSRQFSKLEGITPTAWQKNRWQVTDDRRQKQEIRDEQ